MKYLKYTVAIALLFTSSFITACDSDDGNTIENGHTIVYAVNGNEQRTTISNDNEWDRMLDQFCDFAQAGQTVIFYDLNVQMAHSQKNISGAKEVVNYTTTSREEIKVWMKQMEQAGKTVSVIYDDHTGTWKGTAYINVPSRNSQLPCFEGQLCYTSMPSVESTPGIDIPVVGLKINDDTTLLIVRDSYIITLIEELDATWDEGDWVTLCGEVTQAGDMLFLDISDNESVVTGTWLYYCSAITHINNGNWQLNTDVSVVENNTVYNLYEDGTAHVTTDGNTNQQRASTWSLSGDGEICCNLLPFGGGCWTVNWVGNQSMILSKMDQNNDLFYLIQFERIYNLKNN